MYLNGIENKLENKEEITIEMIEDVYLSGYSSNRKRKSYNHITTYQSNYNGITEELLRLFEKFNIEFEEYNVERRPKKIRKRNIDKIIEANFVKNIKSKHLCEYINPTQYEKRKEYLLEQIKNGEKIEILYNYNCDKIVAMNEIGGNEISSGCCYYIKLSEIFDTKIVKKACEVGNIRSINCFIIAD